MSTSPPSAGPVTKRCFVTIGATAPFDYLLEAVLSPSFLRTLREYDYTELRVQYGEEGQKIFGNFMERCKEDSKDITGLDISGFGFRQEGLAGEMRAAKGGSGAVEGLVISHAGSGSILDAMRYSVPCVVVPNTDLLHNHQLELAEELARLQYVVHGRLDNLAGALPEIEKLRTRMREWPPRQSGEEKYRKGLGGVMDQEMGWVD